MGGYIGARAGTISATVANVQDVTATDTTPEVTIINNTHEDSDLGREGKVIFKGQQSGGEESTLAEIEANHHGSSDDEKGQLVFRTNDGSDGASPTEAMRITSQQRVGILTNDPSDVLHIKGGASTDGVLIQTPLSGSLYNAKLEFSRDGTSGGAKIQTERNASSGGVGLSFSTTADNSAEGSGTYTQRMKINEAGNILVGKAATNFNTAGIEARSGGTLWATADGTNAASFNRKTDDGAIAYFSKDGSTVGGIGAYSGDLYVVNAPFDGAGAGLRYNSGFPNILPCNGTGADRDNAIDLGHSSVRFDDVYATNGTIQTSDETEKQNIASLTSAEITAATAISKLFKTFKWKEKVAAKGDNARTHSGVIAQEVEKAMSDAGLDAGNYAFFISTTWWETQTEVAAVEADEENGIEAKDAYTRTDTYDTKEEAPESATERNRKGIRYPELLSFIGAATEQRLTSIEARLTALEAE
jgi:hypothetical protein